MVTGMDTFGDQLKNERKQRNVELDEISRSTKIRVRYLRALEDGQHERLPGIVFAKGYVRAYAETIGADPERLVTAYIDEQRALGRLETESSHEAVLEALAAAIRDRPDPAGRRLRFVTLGSIAVIVLFVVAWFGVRPVLNRRAVTPVHTVRPTAPVTATAAPLTATATPDPVPVQAAPVESQPTPEPTPEPVPQLAVVTPTLSIPEHGVGTSVRQRALVGESSTFETGTQVVFWTRVLGGESGRVVRHVWSHEGEVARSIELPIGAAHWRTYSKHTVRQSGRWAVEAKDEDGNVLASRSFVATPS
jgi:cytoskeletal protein RodZ